ncbi:hypothetical protein F4703DRAFT_1791295 [Phycomyces blakesleeanus]
MKTGCNNLWAISLCSIDYNIYEIVTSLLLVIRLCEIRTHALPTKVGKTPVKPTKKSTIDRDGGKKSKDKGELHFFRQRRPRSVKNSLNKHIFAKTGSEHRSRESGGLNKANSQQEVDQYIMTVRPNSILTLLLGLNKRPNLLNQSYPRHMDAYRTG